MNAEILSIGTELLLGEIVDGNAAFLAGELAECIHLLRFGELSLNPGKLHLRFAALGDVAGDLGEAAQASVGVADRIDHHVRPEAGAVLANPEAFLFEAALALGGGERARRLSRRAVRTTPGRAVARALTASKTARACMAVISG